MIQTLFGTVEQEPSLLEKLKSGVQKTRAGLVTALEDALQGKKQIDADLLDELEYTLISADIGVNTTNEILESIRQRVERHQLADAGELKNLIREHQTGKRQPVAVNFDLRAGDIRRTMNRYLSARDSALLGPQLRGAESEEVRVVAR